MTHPIEKGFEFVATDDTLFTEILDFPVGEDDLFTVMVDDLILGEFSPGDRVDFLSLLGSGVSRFKVTDGDRSPQLNRYSITNVFQFSNITVSSIS